MELAVQDPEQLYVDLAPAVLGYLRAQGASDPEDMLGDVFVNVVKGLPRFVGDHLQARRWVFTIAHARIVDDRRRRRRRPATLAAFPADHAFHLDAPTFTDPELIAALRALTPDQRDVVVLRFVADLPIGEVAALLGKRPAAVKAQQHRALNRLATLLGSAAGSA